MPKLPKEFRPVFRYRIVKGKICDTKILSDDRWRLSGVVYARVWGKAIAYIGKTDGRLSRRIRDHVRRIPLYTKKKDIEYRKWAEGKTITTYAYKPAPVKLFGIEIPIHASAEAALIDALNPPSVARK